MVLLKSCILLLLLPWNSEGHGWPFFRQFDDKIPIGDVLIKPDQNDQEIPLVQKTDDSLIEPSGKNPTGDVLIKPENSEEKINIIQPRHRLQCRDNEEGLEDIKPPAIKVLMPLALPKNPTGDVLIRPQRNLLKRSAPIMEVIQPCVLFPKENKKPIENLINSEDLIEEKSLNAPNHNSKKISGIFGREASVEEVFNEIEQGLTQIGSGRKKSEAEIRSGLLKFDVMRRAMERLDEIKEEAMRSKEGRNNEVADVELKETIVPSIVKPNDTNFLILKPLPKLNISDIWIIKPEISDAENSNLKPEKEINPNSLDSKKDLKERMDSKSDFEEENVKEERIIPIKPKILEMKELPISFGQIEPKLLGPRKIPDQISDEDLKQSDKTSFRLTNKDIVQLFRKLSPEKFGVVKSLPIDFVDELTVKIEPNYPTFPPKRHPKNLIEANYPPNPSKTKPKTSVMVENDQVPLFP